MKFRRVKSADNKSAAAMIREVFHEYGAPKKGTVYSDPTTDKLYELFQKDNSILFVAEEEGRIVGTCGVFPTNGLPDKTLEIVKFYVSKEVRGTGVGRTLYTMAEEHARSLGIAQLYIESTPAFRHAVSLYKKIGYQSLSAALGNSGHSGCDIWLLKRIA